MINVPAEYINIYRNADKKSRPYDVTYLKHTFFKKVADVTAYKSIHPGGAKGDSKVTDIRALKYARERDIFYKWRFGDALSLITQGENNNIINRRWNELELLYKNILSIKKRKYENLQQISNILPAESHDYYKNRAYI